MKKTYIIPAVEIIILKSANSLLAGSGVADGDNVGDEYTSTDVTFSRNRIIDEDEWEDE